MLPRLKTTILKTKKGFVTFRFHFNFLVMKKYLSISFIAVIFFVNACNNTDKKTVATTLDTTAATKPDTTKSKVLPAVEKPAIINIIDTIAPKRLVIYMKDSAKTFERIAPKLAVIYGVKLGDVLKKNNLKMVGPPIAWYKNLKTGFFFEAGVPVDKNPNKIPATVFVREINTDSALVAHFYGPYKLLPQGYDAIKERMKDENKKPNGEPYEIYIDDPMDKKGNLIDPYKVRTDIVFPRR